jgi:pimeloyl-ACP methyl ester carboxylesterase
MAEEFVVGDLVGELWPGGDTRVVLLHEGVADRRGWYEVAGCLAPEFTVVAYDRRGFGASPVSKTPFSHLDDLLAVLDEFAAERAWLVGASAGGRLALDAALAAPSRVAGLVLSGPAVSGAPEPEFDPDTQRLDALLEKAWDAKDADEANRLETWIWLDGPAQPEGRVTGPARELALDMNAIVIRNEMAAGEAPENAGPSAVDAWSRLAEITVPVTVACGELDVPFILARSRVLAERLPRARFELLPGMAHQPYLESARTVARLIRDAVTG